MRSETGATHIPEDGPILDLSGLFKAGWYHVVDQRQEFGDDVTRAAATEFVVRLKLCRMQESFGRVWNQTRARERNQVEQMVKETMGQEWFEQKYERNRLTKGDEIDQLRDKRK